MATKWPEQLISFSLLLIIFVKFTFQSNVIVYSEEFKKPCTYFGTDRHPQAQLGLANCSWFLQDCCCKRTEVTSVFSSMDPLIGATKQCSQVMNYLMCFFCSPDQHIWYKKKKAHVCVEFCTHLYQECQTALYDGTRIGDEYKNGTALCEAQNFEVVEGGGCFKFDPTVFGKADRITVSSAFIYITLFYVFCICVYADVYVKFV